MKTINYGDPNVISGKTKRTIKCPAINSMLAGIAVIFSILIITGTGCKKDDEASQTTYQQTNLVSDMPRYNAERVDTKLVNPWGIAIGSTGAFWISAAETGYSTVYDRKGSELLAAVAIPSPLNTGGGKPTGVVYNNTSSFMGNKFIFAGEDGVVSAWASGDHATIVANRSLQGAVYKGIAIASDGGADFLYLADFKGNNIDVFDANFNYITSKTFDDPEMPGDYAPFNIYNHDGKLYVTYAKQGADKEDDQPGIGNGYVDIFNPDGSLLKRFASHGSLNSPWAVVDAPEGFGQGDEAILIGNFGDGKISVFTEDGTYKGQLSDGTRAISIDGLWGLAFPENGVPAGDQNQLFFTAGPDDEQHGLFGYLSVK